MINPEVPGLTDVAQIAGVSTATVSRFLNGTKVRPCFEVRIKQAIDQLNYKPNLVARSMRKRKSGVIGMIVPRIEHPYFSALLEGASREAGMHDQGILVSSSCGQWEIENRIIDQFSRSHIDGLIYTPVATDKEFINSDSFHNLPVMISGRGETVYSQFPHIYQDMFAPGVESVKTLNAIHQNTEHLNQKNGCKTNCQKINQKKI